MYLSARGRGSQGAQGAEGAQGTQGKARALLGLSADIHPQSRGRSGAPGKPGRSVLCPDTGAVLLKSTKQVAVVGPRGRAGSHSAVDAITHVRTVVRRTELRNVVLQLVGDTFNIRKISQGGLIGALRYDVAQWLEDDDKNQAQENAGIPGAFLAFDRAQALTQAQKTRGQQNLGIHIDELKGPKGDDGEPGLNGRDGIDGTNGTNGADGADGANSSNIGELMGAALGAGALGGGLAAGFGSLLGNVLGGAGSALGGALGGVGKGLGNLLSSLFGGGRGGGGSEAGEAGEAVEAYQTT